jgi:hypothetical protein
MKTQRVPSELVEDYRSVTVTITRVGGEWTLPAIDAIDMSPLEAWAILDHAATRIMNEIEGEEDDEEDDD